MPIPLACDCGNQWKVDEDQAGTTVACSKCATTQFIPTSGVAPTAEYTKADLETAANEYGLVDDNATKLEAPSDTVAEPRQPHVHTLPDVKGSLDPTEEFEMPGGVSATIAQSEANTAVESSEGYTLGTEEPPPDPPAGLAHCPRCQALIESVSIICIHCGYNRNTGDVITTTDDDESPGVIGVLAAVWVFIAQTLYEFRYAISGAVVGIGLIAAVSIWLTNTQDELRRQGDELMRKNEGMDRVFIKVQEKADEGLRRFKNEDPEIAGPKAEEQYLIAMDHLREGQRDKAREKLQEVITRWPTQTAAMKAKDKLKELEKEAEEARNAILEQSEAKARSMIEKARAMAAEGKIEDARRHLTAVLDVLGETKAAEQAREELKKLEGK